MSLFEVAVVVLLAGLIGLSGFAVAVVRRMYAQQYVAFQAREAREAGRASRRTQRQLQRATRIEEKAEQALREKAAREVMRRREQPARERRRKAYMDAREARGAAMAEQFRGIQATLVRMLTHLRHMDPEVHEEPMVAATVEEAPDSERADAEPSDARGPSVALLPPTPGMPSDERKPTPTQPSMPSPVVRESKPAVVVVDRSEAKRSSLGDP